MDDGAPEIIVKIISGDHVGALVITERNRDRIIFDGWTKFARLRPHPANPPPARDQQTCIHDEPRPTT
ncbi:MAG: hypothetical protein HDKAJFGB_03199 [Anaerolineae bacterium]|nr:hypothetical protein [Anaerolineae bacterium]RIK32818.1 MAG: hypothetical protein DCC52_04690 [Chloroflexota bacterium]